MLSEVPWATEALPAGSFSKISDLLNAGRRIVLTAIEPNEPVLAVKVTGAGQRATLSSLVRPGMKAVTIRVNEVEGVGGFVLPGDHVDVVLTRATNPATRRLQKSFFRTRAFSRSTRSADDGRPKRRSPNP